MNLQLIREIVNSQTPDEIKRDLIISAIAKDESAIPDLLSILSAERKNKKELILDLNQELSKAHVYIEGRPESKEESKKNFNKEFLLKSIEDLYRKYKGIISHNFNRLS